MLVRHLVVVMALLAAKPLHSAEAWPRIDAIRFEGNAVTQPHVIERELTVAVGDPADPAAIEASRQSVLDLGLFRAVQIDSVPNGDAVTLVVHLREKRFLLILPRLDTSSDKDTSVGAQLRWSNVAGRNHRLAVTAQEGKFPNDSRRERELLRFFRQKLVPIDRNVILRHVENG